MVIAGKMATCSPILKTGWLFHDTSAVIVTLNSKDLLSKASWLWGVNLLGIFFTATHEHVSLGGHFIANFLLLHMNTYFKHNTAQTCIQHTSSTYYRIYIECQKVIHITPFRSSYTTHAFLTKATNSMHLYMHVRTHVCMYVIHTASKHM